MNHRTKLLITGAALLVVALASFGGVGSAGVGKPKSGAAADVTNVDGTSVASVDMVAKDGKVRVRVLASGLTAGWHGIHIHSVGTCDPNATDTTGAASPFFTAGTHFNPDATTHGAHAGDLPPLLINEDGTGKLIFMTDRFKIKDLDDEDGSAVIIHAAPDNLAHIPAATTAGAERYHSHVDDVFGPDTATKGTGDAGSRFGCGEVVRYQS